jgi:hypothetical protein
LRAAWISALVVVFQAQALFAAGPQTPSPWDPDSGGVIGRVFYDHDGDGGFSRGDEGLSGIRVTTNSGEVVETGPDGRYHLFLLSTGYEVLSSHLVKLDTTTLPAGARIKTPRKLVHLSPALVVRVDFAVEPPMMEAPEAKGIEPATREVPPRLEPAPRGPDILTVLTGKSHPACRVSVDGKPVEVDEESRVYQTEVAIRPGINPYFVTIHCQGGHLEFLLAEIHWVTRREGGDLIMPSKPRTLATCIGPPLGTIPRSPNVDVGCRLEAGVELSLGSQKSPGPVEKARYFRVRLPVTPGTNTFEVQASFGQAREMKSTVSWKISPVRIGGAFLGSMAISLGESGGPVYGGRFRGTMRADLPADLKLILSSGLQTTREEDLSLENFFMPAFNPWVHQRAPDPDDGYLVPADSSMVSDDTPSSSKYLLRVRRKSSMLGWGGFETHDGRVGEIGTYRRALLGAQAAIHPLEDLFPGPEPAFDLALEGFYASENSHQELLTSEPGIVPIGDDVFATPAHEEFLATGGTLYFLEHYSVVEGSERLQVHRRDARTGMTLERRELRRDVDYQVDWRSGRVLLTEPLKAMDFSAAAVRLTATGPAATVLVVDYEHLDAGSSQAAPSTAGGRAAATVRPADGIQLTGALTTVSRWADDDYTLYKGEAQVQFGRTASLWAAYGRSVGSVLTPSYSTDGGLSFQKAGEADRGAGDAYEAGARLDTDFIRGQVTFRRWLCGYADTSLVADRDLTQTLAAITVKPAQVMDIFTRFAGTQQAEGQLLEGGLGLRLKLSKDLALTAEGVYDQGDGGPFGEGHRALAGLRASYRLVEWLTVVAGHQQTVLKDGEGFSARDLTLSTLGTEVQLWERYQVGVEGGWGPDLGNMVRLSLREERGDGGSVFAHTTFSLDHDAVRAGSLSTGQAVPTEEGALVTTAHTFAVERDQSARGQQVGLKVPLSAPWWLSFAYERAELHNALNQGEKRDLFYSPFFDRGLWDLTRPGRRNAVHGRISYLTGPLALSASAEYRVDERHRLQNTQNLMDRYQDLSTHRQAVFTLAGRWRVSDGFALGGRVAWAETVGENPDAEGQNPIPEGRLLEGSLGAAYRPSGLDWIRFLARLNLGQDSRPPRHPERLYYLDRWLSGTFAVLLKPTKYFQPALVLAPFLFEVRYPTGAEDVRPQRTAFVGMLRVGSEIWAGLGVSAEARMGDRKTEGDLLGYVDEGFELGAAVEIFYQLESPDFGGLRLGVGYSFSDLPDAMTDIRTGQKGLFIRLEGML